MTNNNNQGMYNQTYGNPNEQPVNIVGNPQLDMQFQQVQQQAQYQQMNTIANMLNQTQPNPQNNAIFDNVANLDYYKKGYNNISAGTSQYGLADLDAKDWTKYNLFLIIPFFNLVFYLYYAFFKAFIKYPILKEWAKSVIPTCICIDVLYLLVFVFLFL